MNLYKLIYEIKSPVITPFQADTIFGHLCWAIRYIKGEEKLVKFLENFEYAIIIRKNARQKRKKVGLDYEMKDNDIIEIHTT